MASESKWGKGTTEWLKVRSLVNQIFTLRECKEGKGKMDGKFVFAINANQAFSTDKDSAMGQQVAREGLPPAGQYTVRAAVNEKSKTGDMLILEAL